MGDLLSPLQSWDRSRREQLSEETARLQFPAQKGNFSPFSSRLLLL